MEKSGKIINFVFWLSMLLTSNIFSQSAFETYKTLIAKGSVESHEKDVDSLIEDLIKIDSIHAAIDISHNYSLKLYRVKKYEKGLKYVFWEKELYEENDLFNKNYINVIFNAGLFLSNNYDLERSISFFQEVIEKDSFNHRVSGAYFQLGKVFRRMGKYRESEINYLKSIRLYSEQKDYNRLVMSHINLSICYLNINSKESIAKSKSILARADSLTHIFKVSPRRYLLLQNAIASSYLREGNYEPHKARKYYDNILRIGFQYQDKGTLARTYSNLGYLHNRLKSDSAKFFLEKALEYSKDDYRRERIYGSYAEYHVRKNQLDQALSDIQNSLGYLLGAEVGVTTTRNQILNSRDQEYLLYCVKQKAAIYIRLYEERKDLELLKAAMKNIEAAEYTVDLLLNKTTEQDTQMIWLKEASQAYLFGALISHLLGDSEKAFSYMEKNKALLLSEGILKNTEFENLPGHVAEQESDYQKKMYALENQLSQDVDNSALQDSLFVAKEIHQNYVDSLKTIYPKYFARKMAVDQISLAEVQKEIGNKEAILSYVWNEFGRDDERIIGLVSTDNKAQTFYIKSIQEFQEKLRTYQQLISQPFQTKEERKSYQKIAFELYLMLFPTEDVRSLIQGKNLTIIPDGDLQNIPFESLVTQENTNDYLILNGDVNYSYSYSFLKHNDKVNRITEEDFIGYSPSSFESLSLNNLTNSKEEVSNINNELQGRIKLQDTATKEDFLQNSKNSKIIHLATHADVGKNPWIAFSDEKLELHELYTYKNNADLVTLSACNTSLGELAKGEGVLSLARGFFYSGSKSVVSSLWEVNDKSTSKIMTSFYKNLKEGQTKSEAINNAKRAYLNNHSLSEQSPYYWSSFILIGDPGTIDLSSNFWWYILAGIIVFVVLFFLRKRIQKKSA